MARVPVHLKHIDWRDHRPRFEPGPNVRALGYRGEDLKHPDGVWFSLREAQEWSLQRDGEIRARRSRKALGARLKPLRRPHAYTIEAMFEDLWRANRFQSGERKTGHLAPRTIADYKSKARLLGEFDPDLWTSPAAAVSRAVAKGLHERLWAAKGLGMANAMMTVLRLAYSQARDYDRLKDNPCSQMRLPASPVRLRIASPAEIDALMQAADAPDAAGVYRFREVGDAIALGLYTGQREGDVLALEARNEAGGKIRFIQSKTGARVRVRALPQLLARLASAAARKIEAGVRTPTVTWNPATSAAWKEDTFRHQFAKLRKLASSARPTLASLNFQDLRDTAVTRLAMAGCTAAEIASITGHSMETVHKIMRHYLELNEAIADAAMDKVQAWMTNEGVRQ